MNESMSKKTGPSDENHKIDGHIVQIRKQGKVEQLWIDGIRRKFSVTKDGYNLHDYAYAPPKNSLIEAVRSYLEKTPKKGSRDKSM